MLLIPICRKSTEIDLLKKVFQQLLLKWLVSLKMRQIFNLNMKIVSSTSKLFFSNLLVLPFI